jgi:hypothetical protein
MVKTRSSNEAGASENEELNTTSLLREILEKMNDMRKDIEELKKKNVQEQSLPVGLASESGLQKIPRTPAPTEREHIESPNAETVDQTPKNATFQASLQQSKIKLRKAFLSNTLQTNSLKKR